MTKITKQSFGKCDGKEAFLWTIENDQMSFAVTNFGATIQSIKTADKNGNVNDVTLGYDSAEEYLNNSGSVGATMGRVAGRIDQGKFKIDDTEYQLPLNDEKGQVASHGGVVRFSLLHWEFEEIANGVKFTHVSPDGESGFPGELTATAIYTLDGDKIHIGYYATTDKDTIVNLTNHAYFNMKDHACNDCTSHDIEIHADYVYVLNERSLTTTPQPAFLPDFKDMTSVYARDISGKYSDSLHKVVTLSERTSGRRLTISSNAPAIVSYNASHLPPETKGKENAVYKPFGSLCFETQSVANQTQQMVLRASFLSLITTIKQVITRHHYHRNIGKFPGIVG